MTRKQKMLFQRVFWLLVEKKYQIEISKLI